MLHRIVEMRAPGKLKIIPAGWSEIGSPIPFSRAYIQSWGLRVLTSIDTTDDGKVYFHLSVSHQKRLPSWDEMREVKNIFIGHEEEAFQFFPKESEYVNLHKHTLHIWKLMEE